MPDQTSSPSSSSSTSEEIPKKQQRRVSPLTPPNNNLGEDELLVKSFADLIQRKADAGLLASIRLDASDRQGVRDVLRPGVYWGSLAAVTQFVLLRRLPKWYMNRALAKRESFLHGAGGHPHFDSARRETNPLFPRIKTHRDGSTSFKEGFLVQGLTVALDAALSVLTGFAVCLYVVDKKKAFHAISEIPLQPGRSAISDALCHDFIQHDKTLPKRLWKEHTDDAIQTIRRFVDNCKRRSQYEDSLRQSQGLMTGDAPVTIPPPGVPPDLTIEEEEEEKETRFYGADWVEEDDYWSDMDDASDWELDEAENEDYWDGK